MAKEKKKTSQQELDQASQEVQDQPQRDVFDEDEENQGGPPTLNQDAPEKPQDAPGEAPTQVTDNPTITGEVAPVDPEKPLSEDQHSANLGLLDAKGDLAPQQPIFDPTAGVYQGFSFNGKPVDKNDPAFKEFLRQQFIGELSQGQGSQAQAQSPRGEQGKSSLPVARGDRLRTFKVTRGKVGQHAEGTVVVGLASLGLKEESDLARLVEAGVVEELQI